MADTTINDKIALQTVIGLRFVNKSDIVLIHYVSTTADSKLIWTVLLNTGELIRLKQNITAKDILTSLHTTLFVQISQTVIVNVDYLVTIELKTRKCVLASPFEKTDCYVSRLFLKNIRQQFELNI